MENSDQKLEKVIRSAQRVVVLTGSGVSAECGIPTFRGNEGFWKNFSPEELASQKGYAKNPDVVWEWYLERRKMALSKEPNAGHYALAKLASYFDSFTLITQNIDNLHTRAGSVDLLELHGNLFRSKCNNCGEKWDDFEIEFKSDYHICPFCKKIYSVRPDVVWFGEILPQGILYKSTRASEKAELFLVAGTSAVVYPAAQLPVIASNNGAFLVEFNIEKTALTKYANIFIEGKSGSSIPDFMKIVERVKNIPTDLQNDL